MSFVAKEAGVSIGSLTVLSSHATIDLPNSSCGGTTTRRDLQSLLTRVDEAKKD